MKREKIENVKEKFMQLFNAGVKYDEIVKLLNVSKSAICKYVKDNGLQNPKMANDINTNAFKNSDEINDYWLGFLWADGSITKDGSIDVEITDLDHAEKFMKFIGAKKIVKRDRKKSVTYRVTVHCKTLTDRLISLGFDIKDNRINIPQVTNMQAFARGYFDGDGHIRIKDSRFEGVDISGRIGFIDNFKKQYDFFNREGLHSKHSKRIYTTKEKGIDFLKYIYKDASIFLTRKYNSALFYGDIEVTNRTKTVKAEMLIP